MGTASADAPLDADRPGAGNAATTVPGGMVQSELGVNFVATGRGASRQTLWALPLALRAGVMEGFELRGGPVFIGIDTSGAHAQVERTDGFLGAKWALAENAGLVPSLAVMVDVYLPSGRGAFTAGGSAPEARFAAAWSLGDGWSASVNAGADAVPVSGRHVIRALYVANLGFAPPFLGGCVTVFVETYGRIATEADVDPLLQLNEGVAWLVTPDLQLDVYVQHGLTDGAPDLQVASGVSVRF